MKLRQLATAAATLMVLFSASLVLAESDARKSFELLKGMEGNWVERTSRGSRCK